ncbi:hypothetical protein PM082_015509 [Marasmius tenuissimus]|nr:hypothetical protein PM082_015509 [Marasmius tenuissimus]
MGKQFDWLTVLNLKHSSPSALSLLLGACPVVEVVHAGLTADETPTWQRPQILRHTALQELGIVMITSGTGTADLFTVFDGLCCPRLWMLSITCAPGVMVGFQDDAMAESVWNFLVRSDCVLKGGCIHCADVGMMSEE